MTPPRVALIASLACALGAAGTLAAVRLLGRLPRELEPVVNDDPGADEEPPRRGGGLPHVMAP